MSGNYFVLKFQPPIHLRSAQGVGLCGGLDSLPFSREWWIIHFFLCIPGGLVHFGLALPDGIGD